MGNDGGALSNKRSVLQAVLQQRCGGNDDGGAAAAAESAVRDREARCQTCALTGRALELPVVGDERGNLMRRAAVVEMLLARKTGDEACALLAAPAAAGIKKLKHVVTLAVPEAASTDATPVRLTCPLTGLDLSRGAVAFGFFFGCGHYFSEAAVATSSNSSNNAGAQVAAAKACPSCGAESKWIPVVAGATAKADAPAEAAPLKQHRAEASATAVK
mmetsp:Transcript_32946/g.101783  ORF Transcript_32946/g.101783 Transcript_32946/m.101783 type:complete len:217 (-) Transcript_32946:21-671(-)